MAAAKDPLADSGTMETQVQDGDTYDSILFSQLGTILELPPLGRVVGSDQASQGGWDADAGGDGGRDDDAGGGYDGRKVSDPDVMSDCALVSNDAVCPPCTVPRLGGGTSSAVPFSGGRGGVDGAVPHSGGGALRKVRAPAEADSFVADGYTVGRNEADQHQVQGGSQAQGASSSVKMRPHRAQVCLFIRKGDCCEDQGCQKLHSPLCRNPQCLPRWRKDCPLWHVRRPPSGTQGNRSGAGPGRAGVT